MSPSIRPVPASAPSHPAGRSGAEGGTTLATGTPNRVTRTGLRVLRTRSRTDKHVALNCEMAICSTAVRLRSKCIMVIGRGRRVTELPAAAER